MQYRLRSFCVDGCESFRNIPEWIDVRNDVRNIAEDIAASTVPLAEWKPLKINPHNVWTCAVSGNSHDVRSARRTTPVF